MMKTIKAAPGSFRDPSGRVYEVGERIFRTVNPSFAEEYEFVHASGLMRRLAEEDRALSAVTVDPSLLGSAGTSAKYVLECPKLPFVSFPYEWSFPALKAAALLHLDIHLTALDQGVTLSDSSAYNVQFYGTRPVFIDHLSFIRYREGEVWAGHRQYCEQFLIPLLLRALFGITHNAWYRGTQEGILASDLKRLLRWRHYLSWNILTHIVLPSMFQGAAKDNQISLNKESLSQVGLPLDSLRRMLKKLHNWISHLHPLDTGKTIWTDYAKNHSYSTEETEIKKQFVMEFVRNSLPRTLWDLGCNTGDYSVTALEAGAKYVVGFDFDQGALEKAFARAQESNLFFQPLFMDAANPSPGQGWREQERQSLKARANADALIALAFIHHLAIARNIPFEELVDWVMSFAPQGIIEFIPKQDPMVEKLLALREDIFPDYTKECFLAYVSSRAKIIKTVQTSKSGRFLIWYSKS
jgi:ribosomal protein L11 methylase PrmA